MEDAERLSGSFRVGPRAGLWRADILEEISISDPPETWQDFVEAVGKMTKIEGGRLEREGMAPPDSQEHHAWFMEITSSPIIIGGKSELNRADGRTTM